MNNILDTILFSNVINLFIVIMFFIWLFRKYNLLSLFTKKREEIVDTIKNLEHDRKLKEHQLELTKTKVQNVAEEVSKMIDDGEQVAESISNRIIEDAEKEAVNMQKKAHLTIENERKIAANEVMQEVTTAAFSLAQEKINSSIDEKMHKKYIDNFIDNLGNLNK